MAFCIFYQMRSNEISGAERWTKEDLITTAELSTTKQTSFQAIPSIVPSDRWDFPQNNQTTEQIR